MASTILFVVMAVIAIILLLVAAIFATIGAGRAFASPNYNTDARIRMAHQMLTVAAILGWSSFAVLIVVMIVGAISGGFTTAEVSDLLLYKQSPTRQDLLIAYTGEKELTSGQVAQIIVLVVLFIVAAIVIILGILTIIAATQLAGVKQQDDDTRGAYTMAIAASVAAVGGVGIMAVAIIAYFAIRSAREKQVQELKAFTTRAETKLGISPQTQIITPTHAKGATTPVAVSTPTGSAVSVQTAPTNYPGLYPGSAVSVQTAPTNYQGLYPGSAVSVQTPSAYSAPTGSAFSMQAAQPTYSGLYPGIYPSLYPTTYSATAPL